MKTLSLFPVLLFALALRIGAQESWVAQNSNATGILFSVDFVDSNTGYVDGFRKTTNGGTTWTSLINNADQWQGQDFVDANTGYVVGLNGDIAKTTNGGTNWTVNNSFLGSATWRAVYFMNANTGWVVGSSPDGATNYSGYILKTTSGGSQWTTQSFSRRSFFSVFFFDANNGWIAADSGYVYKTTNGGTVWTRQITGSPSILRSVHFVNANTGWAVGDRGTIMKTTNGGITWVSQNSGLTANLSLNSVFFVNSQVGWAVGALATMLKTTDGGSAWLSQTIPMQAGPYGFNDVFFMNESIGWAVGSSGTILKHTGITTSILTGGFSNQRIGILQQGIFNYQLPISSWVTIRELDPHGRLILKLVDGIQSAGQHTISLPSISPAPVLLDYRDNRNRNTVLITPLR